jgi:N,N'-diacetyllegionaminate synthase
MGTGESVNRCVVIAEVAQAHDGSLGLAHAYIDVAARCGVDAIKFQTHIADSESTPAEPWRVEFSPQDSTRYDYWRRMEFSEAQWKGLKQHADERGLLFLSSPFSPEAVDLLSRVGVVAWKVASGEVTSPDLLARIAATRLPVWISTGMSTFAEIDQAVELVRASGLEFALFQCTSEYPTPPEKLGLNVIGELRERYRCPVGLSDHSGKIYAGLAAATIGVDLLEVHMTLSPDMFGPDTSVSLTPDRLSQLVEGVRFIESARANSVDKDAIAEELSAMRSLFRKSLVTARDLRAGELITRSDVRMKKPGSGIPATEIENVIGRRLVRTVPGNTFLKESDFE